MIFPQPLKLRKICYSGMTSFVSIISQSTRFFKCLPVETGHLYVIKNMV